MRSGGSWTAGIPGGSPIAGTPASWTIAVGTRAHRARTARRQAIAPRPRSSSSEVTAARLAGEGEARRRRVERLHVERDQLLGPGPEDVSLLVLLGLRPVFERSP